MPKALKTGPFAGLPDNPRTDFVVFAEFRGRAETAGEGDAREALLATDRIVIGVPDPGAAADHAAGGRREPLGIAGGTSWIFGRKAGM